MRSLSHVFAAALVIVCLMGCGGGGGAHRVIPPSGATGSIEGYVYEGATKGSLMVSGRAEATRQPVDGANISVRGYASLTDSSDASGFFHIDNIPCGARQLSIEYTAHTRLLLNVTVNEGTNTVTPPDLITPAKHKWTVMVYMAADNDLDPWGVADLNEMERGTPAEDGSGSPPAVRTLALFDRAGLNNTTIYQVQHDTTDTIASTPLETGERNTGDPDTLHYFVNFCQQYAPAEHYLLVLWDHGSGWNTYQDKRTPQVTSRAICVDDSSSGAIIRDVDLPAAIAGRDPIDIVATDACLMAMLEVAYELRNSADYLVAAEEETPLPGFDYEPILRTLNSPAWLLKTPAQIAAYISQQVYLSWSLLPNQSANLTSSVIDLTRVDAVAAATQNLANILTANAAKYAAEITYARQRALHFGGASLSILDLADFAAQLNAKVNDTALDANTAALSSVISSVVLDNSHSGGDYNRAHGISIYFPSLDYYALPGTASNYGILALSKDTTWDDWLAAQAQ